MRSSISLSSALLLASTAVAQNATTNSSSFCAPGYFEGLSEVIYISPYNYSQVMSVIGSFKNLTWSGNPDNTVTLNGTDNTVGTSRTYSLLGAQIVETITNYSKPANGPYDEIHVFNSASMPFVLASANLSIYAPYDGTTVVEACGGLASIFNFTAHYCATNATAGGELLHMAHLSDAEGANAILGNMNFTSCAALNATHANSTAAGNATMSMTASMTTSEGLAAATGASASALNSMAISSAESSASKASAATASGASATASSAAAPTAGEPFAASWVGIGYFWLTILGASAAVVVFT